MIAYKAVEFYVNEKEYYTCHLKLSTASTILRVLKEYPASQTKNIYRQARMIKWAKYFSSKKTFRVDATIGGRGKHLPDSNSISKQVREAIQDDFYSAKKEKPLVSLKNPQVLIVVFYSEHKLTISCNTALTSLHKRGYRSTGHPAPLKENYLLQAY